MDIKPRQCIAALNAHVRSGFPLVGDAETSVYAKDIIETIQRLVLKLNEANKAYEASEVDSGFEALTAYHHGRQDGFESAQPKWISVEERYPADDQCVMYVDDGEVDFRIVRGWALRELCEFPEHREVHRITHWMPVPEPPEEDEHE